MLKKILVAALALLVLAVLGLYAAGMGSVGRHEAPGKVSTQPRPEAAVRASRSHVTDAASQIGVARPKQILFGDLHVHTTFSFDAFMLSLPLSQGEGTHPPADACDFARHCSALDFWSINDHSEAITPRHWRETIDSIRQCNAIATDPANPDTVAFLGWEWTDVGSTRENHYGHKNVVLAHTEEERIPARPIAAASTVERTAGLYDISPLRMGALAATAGHPRYRDLVKYFAERRGVDHCPEGFDVHDLPTGCLETARTPADLFRKLDEWGHDAIVIPHGTTWGFYTPPGSTWDKQLAGDMHDPARQTLMEIYSGHGNSEQYRDWRAVGFDAAGSPTCPEERPDYLPACQRAGQLVRERCLAEGTDPAECEARAETAKANAAAALGQAHLTVPGATASDWLDAGQCRDCDEPAFNYRPGGAAQYVMALGNFDEAGPPRRFRFGFMASSDNHFARPGTGYKEVHRAGFTESRARASASGAIQGFAAPPPSEPVAHSVAFDRQNTRLQVFALMELERQASFFLTGGLIAAHATGRDRGSIWQALEAREVYGTTGPRILLWFDLLNAPGTSGRPAPMGTAVEMDQAPIFQVRAVGSYEQKPGCPDTTLAGLGAERTEYVCRGECYNPSDQRRLITRIEVIRIRPQQAPDEDVASLIEDPWRVFECEPKPEGCAVTFSDPEHTTAGRDALYYVRALESPAPAINAGGPRCTYDADGRCTAVDLCGPDPTDECLGSHEPRAWSSPIFVDWPRSRAAAAR